MVVRGENLVRVFKTQGSGFKAILTMSVEQPLAMPVGLKNIK